MTLETAEKHAIKDYLAVIGAFNWPITQGLGCYPGLPDRFCLQNGRIYAIEVKAGKKYIQSEHQKQFQRDFEDNGGVYICGGVDAVMAVIKPIFKYGKQLSNKNIIIK